MKITTPMLYLSLSLIGTAVLPALAQQQAADPERTPGVQAGPDPMRTAWVMQHCSNPAMPEQGGRGRGGGGPGTPAPPSVESPASLPMVQAGVPCGQIPAIMPTALSV